MSRLRLYREDDYISLLKVFDLLIPRDFHPDEKKGFEDYLIKEREEYYVVEVDNGLIGGGGINFFPREKKAYLSWGFIHPDFQGNGWGKQLVNRRIHSVSTRKDIEVLHVRTSQHAWAFYQKMGFSLIYTEDNYWGPDLHLYDMTMQFQQR